MNARPSTVQTSVAAVNANRWWAAMKAQRAAGEAAGYRRGWKAGARWGAVVGFCVSTAATAAVLLVLQQLGVAP